MVARWSTFAAGLWLVLAPLVLGYGAVGPILHHVAIGLLVCVATLAALDTPGARFLMLGPGAWLAWSARTTTDPAAAAVELLCGPALLLLTLFPNAPFTSRARARAAPESRAGARA